MKYRYREPHEMKDSGVEWLGMIPREWEVKKAKRIFELKKEKSFINNPIVLSLTMKGLKIRDISTNEGQLASTYEGYMKIEKNDFVLNPMDLISGYVDKAEIEGVISPAYITFRARKENLINHDYYKYYFQMHYHHKFLWPWGQGVSIEHRWTLKNETFLNLPCLGSEHKNQQKIADFLDLKCSQFDSIIEKKESLITKLEEAKKSLISEVVTGKVKVIEKENGSYEISKREPHEMKDSGVEWLGMIPREWEVTKIKWITQTESGATPLSGNIEEYYDGNISWLRTTDLNDSYIYENEINITEKAVKDCSCRILPIDSCLVAMYGGSGTIGKNGLLKIPSCINQAVCAILPSDKYNSEFLYYYLNFYRSHWMIDANGTRKDPNINQDVVRNLKFIKTTLENQNLLVKFLSKNKFEIEKIIEKQKELIEKLKKAKQSLISEAVTGKIEVL